MTNITELLDTLQNNPITLVFLAAIAATLALLFFFPAILNLVPATVIREKTKKTHRRPIFFAVLFVVLSLVVGTVYFVPGVREKLENLNKPAEQTTESILYGHVLSVDKDKNIVTIAQVTTETKYQAEILSSTKIIDLGTQESLGIDAIKDGQTVEIVGQQSVSSKDSVKAQKISIYPQNPSPASLPQAGGGQ